MDFDVNGRRTGKVWTLGILSLIRSALRSVRGRSLLRSIVLRCGASKYWWRYRHFVDGSYRDGPVVGLPDNVRREQMWLLCSSFVLADLVEVGCGDGANLAFFARKAPLLRLHGIDVNPFALALAERQVQDAGGRTGIFLRGSADKLPLADGSVDVVLSDAVFMYLTPGQATAAIREMRRVARKAFIVHTFADDSSDVGSVIEGNWVHGLAGLLRTTVPDASWSRYPSQLVTSEAWRQHGSAYVVQWQAPTSLETRR